MSIIQKLHDLLLNNNDDEEKIDFEGFIGIDKTQKLPQTSEYRISPYEAFQIASKNENLKTDYFKRASEFISYLDFTDCKYELVDGDNGKKYWLIRITEGDISSIYTDENLNSTFADGNLTEEDSPKLQCLIDVETGEYIYFPTEK